MRKTLLILGLLGLIAAALSVPAVAKPVQIAVAEVLDGANLGQVGFRVWSLYTGAPTPPAGPTCDINANAGAATSCSGGSNFAKNTRCLITYNTTNTDLNGGGYIDYQESTGAYNGDAPGQVMCALADAELTTPDGKKIGYWGASCRTSLAADTGLARANNCPGATLVTCLDRLDTSEPHHAGAAALQNTAPSYPTAGSHMVASTGGLDPVPIVRATKGAGCNNGTTDVCLEWDKPSDYASSMNGTVDFVKGTNLYRQIVADCAPANAPNGDNGGWGAPIATFANPASDVDHGGGGTSNYLDLNPGGGVGCAYYATTVLVQGPRQDCVLAAPSNPPNTETGNQGGGQRTDHFVGGTSPGVNLSGQPTAVRIVRFNATYAGRGVVNVNWQSGLEGDVSGFYVTRSTTANGPFARVSDLVRAKGDNSNYAVSDKIASASGRVYYYQLQIALKDGSVKTSSTASVTLPSRVKKAGPSISN